MIGVGVAGGGPGHREGVALGRTGSGRLGLARQTQVDCGEGEEASLQIQLPPHCAENRGQQRSRRGSGLN